MNSSLAFDDDGFQPKRRQRCCYFSTSSSTSAKTSQEQQQERRQAKRDLPILVELPEHLTGRTLDFCDYENLDWSICTVGLWMAKWKGVDYILGLPEDMAVTICRCDYKNNNNDNENNRDDMALVPMDIKSDFVKDELFPVAQNAVDQVFNKTSLPQRKRTEQEEALDTKEEIKLKHTPYTLTITESSRVSEASQFFASEDEILQGHNRQTQQFASILSFSYPVAQDEENNNSNNSEEEEEKPKPQHDYILARALEPQFLVAKRIVTGSTTTNNATTSHHQQDHFVLLTNEEADSIIPLLDEAQDDGPLPGVGGGSGASTTAADAIFKNGAEAMSEMEQLERFKEEFHKATQEIINRPDGDYPNDLDEDNFDPDKLKFGAPPGNNNKNNTSNGEQHGDDDYDDDADNDDDDIPDPPVIYMPPGMPPPQMPPQEPPFATTSNNHDSTNNKKEE